MKKEAVNTFGEGLIMDLNPLTTPNNVLTGCLNGTSITYNGNEFVLQNDMGNGEVHTAYLEKGYVPVGMKEHGGIIYVAAHNPVSGKSQVGSFPSPQQLYEGDDLDVKPIEFNFSEFIEMKGMVPYIKQEYYKQKLFQSNTSGEVKIFHPGDRFVVVSGIIPTEIRQAISDGAVKLRLGVINSNGNIDYIEDKNLRTYASGLWVYENSNTPMEDILASKELIQVFSAKSSGELILVIELKTFSTFNLVRKYSCSESNVITVKFIGETSGTFSGTSESNPSKVGIIEENNSTVLPSISKSGKSGTITYNIMPVSPYGVLQRLGKRGTIDFDAIRANSESLGEWRFYVTETYLKVGWGYDYYNLNEDSDIEKIEFTFISLTKSSEARNAATLGGYKHTISKEYYNGSFEEIIPFSDSTISKNWIYIVRIDRYVKGVKKLVGYRTIYTGSYFNSFYEEIQDFNTGLPSGTDRSKVRLDVVSEVRTDIKPGGVTTEVKLHDATSFTPKNTLVPSDYVKEVSVTEVNYKYNTRKVRSYDVTVEPYVSVSYDNKQFAGKHDTTIEDGFFGSGAYYRTPDNSNIAFNNSSTLTADISADTIKPEAPTISYNPADKLYKGKISTYRNIIAANGAVKQVVYNGEKLLPIYSSSIGAVERDNLFCFREDSTTLYCVTGARRYCSYPSAIVGVEHTTGNSGKGAESSGSSNEAGLRIALAAMGNGTIGIMGGHDGDSASLRMEGSSYSSAAWFRKDREIDGQDNYLIATWKDIDGNAWLINLASRKTENSDVTKGSTLIRVEKMLKCFLSQMLVAKRSSGSANIVGPNSTEFTYHSAFDTACDIVIPVSKAGQSVDVNFFLDGSNDSIETHMNRWVAAISELKNYLPIFKIEIPLNIVTTILYGSDITFNDDSNILNCYTSAYSSYLAPVNSLTEEQRSTIYICDPATYTGTNGDGSLNFSTSSGKYKVASSSSSMLSWDGASIALGYNINDRFVNAYRMRRGGSGEIPDGFYNEVYIKNYRNCVCTWTGDGEDHTGSAPDMAINIGFGSKSVFLY